MISQTGEYALRAVVDLAYHYGASRTSQQIAAATKVPAGYLAKVLQSLAKGGLVESQRGLGGGFALTRNPHDLSVYDVLAAVDPPSRIRTCPLGLASHKTRLCLLHQRLDDAMAAAEKAFRDTTIADVTADPSAPPLRERRTEITVSGGLSNRSTARRR